MTRRPRLRLTLRLRLTVLFGALLLTVSGGLVAVAVMLFGDAVRHLPQLHPDTTVRVGVGDGSTVTMTSAQLQSAVATSARERFVRTALLGSGAVVVVGLAAGWILSGQALHPVSRLTATARHLTAETASGRVALSQRIALTGPEDEVTELADTFDQMLERLDGVFASQSQFIANASHELRTPLAVMRTEVDVALADPDASAAELRRMGEVVREATVRADQLIQALLVLAQAQAAQAQAGQVPAGQVPAGQVQAAQAPAARVAALPGTGPVELDQVARRSVAEAGTVAAARRIRLECRAGTAAVDGHRVLLERMVGNLVANAVGHNVDGGWVSVECDATGGVVRLVVTNTGAELDPEAVAGFFTPFIRGTPPRTSGGGTGLGLPIVRAVAGAHRGGVDARPRPGGGLVVTVTLPESTAGPGTEAPGTPAPGGR